MTMSLSKIAIIIPNYNGEKFILDTIHSLSKGFSSDIKIIVIDDASTDNSVNLLNSQKINVIHRKNNGGFGATVNSGFNYLIKNNFNYAIVCNSDLDPSYEQCNLIEESVNKNLINKKCDVLGFLEKDSDKEKNYDITRISGFLFAINLQIIITTGNINENFYMYGEEEEFFRRVLKKGFNITQSGIVVHHKSEQSAKSKYKNTWYVIRNALYMEVLDKNFYMLIRKIFMLLLIILRLHGDKENASISRIRRGGPLFGLLILMASIPWNLVQFIKILPKG